MWIRHIHWEDILNLMCNKAIILLSVVITTCFCQLHLIKPHYLYPSSRNFNFLTIAFHVNSLYINTIWPASSPMRKQHVYRLLSIKKKEENVRQFHPFSTVRKGVQTPYVKEDNVDSRYNLFSRLVNSKLYLVWPYDWILSRRMDSGHGGNEEGKNLISTLRVNSHTKLNISYIFQLVLRWDE